MEDSGERRQPAEFKFDTVDYRRMIEEEMQRNNEVISSNTLTEETRGTDVSSKNNQGITIPAPTDGRNKKNWIISMQQKLYRYPLLDEEQCSNLSIFRVPKILREIEPEAYTPQIISIGPIHRGKFHLRYMEEHKWRFLRRCLDRTGYDLELYINTISQLVARTRRCYASRIFYIDDQDFIEMILLDSCFIIELLLAAAQGFSRNYDFILAIRAFVAWLRRDMLLLENQIPLFVLDHLFPITAGPEYRGYSVSQLALRFFGWTAPGSINIQETPNTGNEDEEGLHFLNVIRQSLVPLRKPSSSSSPPPNELLVSRSNPHLMMQCVSMLRDAGVKFKKKTSRKSTDIEFKGGVLEIPPLVVNHSTKSIFLNLMAFEQCNGKCSDEISSYVVFMNGLINTPEDVGYLQQKGIINHQLGSNEAVAQLFNDLCREISIDHMDDSYLLVLSSELNEYVSRKWPTWRASLKREYFLHSWSTISAVVVVLAICLMLTQILYSMIA